MLSGMVDNVESVVWRMRRELNMKRGGRGDRGGYGMMTTTKTVMEFITPARQCFRLLYLPLLTHLRAKTILRESGLNYLSEEESTVANVLWMTGPRFSHVASVAKSSRGKRGRMRTMRSRIRKSGSGRSKGGRTPPGIVL